MGEYNYSAPYRGTGAALPEGYLNTLMQPGRNIASGVSSGLDSIAEGIGKYYKNKEERAGAQALAEGAVSQYLQTENLVPESETVSDSNPKDRYFAKLQKNQKNIINVVGEKTFNKFQEGKASTSEMLGLVHSLNVYDTKQKERQAVDLQRQQFNLNKETSIAATKLAEENLNMNKKRLETENENSKTAKSLNEVVLEKEKRQLEILVNEVDTNKGISNALTLNPKQESESQTAYYTRILDGMKTPVSLDARRKMLSAAQDFDKNIPTLRIIDRNKFLEFGGTLTKLLPNSKGNYIQAYTVAGKEMPGIFVDYDTGQIIQINANSNNPIAAALQDPAKSAAEFNEQRSKIENLSNNSTNAIPPNVGSSTNAIPLGVGNLRQRADGSFNFIPTSK